MINGNNHSIKYDTNNKNLISNKNENIKNNNNLTSNNTNN